MHSMSIGARGLGILALIGCLLGGNIAWADGPVLGIQGRLTNAAGVAAPDGKYGFEINLYASEDAVDSLYTELLVGVSVNKGIFSALIGVNSALDPTLFAENPILFVGVAAQGEPELPRQRVHHAAVAMHSYSTTSLQCTGCIQADHLNPAILSSVVSDLDLHPVAKSGAYADLTGTPDVSKLAGLEASNVFTGQNEFTAEVGIGESPAAGCALNVGSVCVGGQPRLTVMVVDGALPATADAGQIAFRTQTELAYLYTGSAWRLIVLSVVCGDGVVDDTEECDDGDNNANTADKCRTNCKEPTCGDNILDSDEECDDGEDNANTADKCRTTCKTPFCGDGIQDADEACDDGNKNDSDACSNSCKSTITYHMNGIFYVSNATFDGSFNAAGGFCTNMVGQTAYIAHNSSTLPNQEAGGTWNGNGSSPHASNNCLLYSTASGSGYGVQGGYGPCNVKRHVVCSTNTSHCNGGNCSLWD